ncbi:hypothetical protein G6F52_013736 [Rhizopus delemar]|uniref:Uncharacterized protein n=1 Tax=Rhizopus delemar TaxID=936053 RepID=A0A9P6XR19_9FUNG|nr:hypothetical protein G6F52_013736 [Rhizopus delemar]KAG1530600.1 hypothetical protein G6F50_017209 [Rhizopus delemar]
MPPQETDENDGNTIVLVHAGTEPDPEQTDEDGNHLERDQEEERQKITMEIATAQVACGRRMLMKLDGSLREVMNHLS